MRAKTSGTDNRRPLTGSTLPEQATRLIGRQKELQSLCAMVAGDDVRLITLTGPPGTGKTRLALTAAGALREQFDDRIWLVELASVTDPKLVPSAIAEAIGVREAPALSVLSAVQGSLAREHALLVLDNFEQILPGAACLSDLLALCPGVTVLATSRAALRLRWEQEFPVLPLRLPSLARMPTLAELAETPAVQLFLDRAAAVSPSFSLREENASSIAELCARLDGLPLAIELAAAQTKLFSPTAILARLRDRLPLADRGPRDAPVRQRTLAEAIGWSYSLLRDQEQALLRRLGVLSGGFDTEAAAAVCDAGQSDSDTLEGLAALVEQNMVTVEPQPDGSLRFAMLETIREFALNRLAEAGELGARQRRHAVYFLTLAEKAEPELWGESERLWLDRLDREQGNIRSALGYFLDNDIEYSLRFTAALWRYWELAGNLSEGRGRLERVLNHAEEAQVPLSSSYATALLGAGYLARDQGDVDVAGELFGASLSVSRELSDKKAIGSALRAQAVLAQSRGESEVAQARFKEALAYFQQIDHQLGIGWILRNLGILAQQAGDFERAGSLYEESFRILEDLGDRPGSARALGNLGILARSTGSLDEAHIHLNRSLDLLERAGDRRGISLALSARATLSLRRGLVSEAIADLHHSVELAHDLGDTECLGRGLALLGAALTSDGDRATGLTLLAVAARLPRASFEPDEVSLLKSAHRRAAKALTADEIGRAEAEAATLSMADIVTSALVVSETPASSGDTLRSARGAVLSHREAEVLREIAAGKTNREIAAELVLSEFTVMRHVSNILRKLDVPSRAAAVSRAASLGILRES